jgi:hypothetical protein
MNRREKKFIHLMIMVVGVCFKAAHNPESAFLSLRKGVETASHHQKIIAMINDLYAGFGTSLAAMNHLRAQQFTKLEIEFV